MVKGKARDTDLYQGGGRAKSLLLKNVTGLQPQEKAMVPCPEVIP